MRPSNALVTSTLPVSGIRFQWDLERLELRGARDAANAQLLAIINWDDQDEFLKEVVGYATYNKLSALQRVPPLRHPFRSELWCEEYQLLDCGAYEDRSDLHDPANPRDPAAPALDWMRVLLTFGRPKWPVLTDAQLADPALLGLNVNKEQFRFTHVTQQPQPRNRKISGFGYEFLDPNGVWKTITDEAQFIPDYAVTHIATWVGVPEIAVPYDAILNALNTVNDNTFQLSMRSKAWPRGWLAFKGVARPIESYVAANGELSYDLMYHFDAQPGSWQSYLTRDAAGERLYRPIRIRLGVGAGFPPFVESDFQKLFVPG